MDNDNGVVMENRIEWDVNFLNCHPSQGFVNGNYTCQEHISRKMSMEDVI